MNAGPGVTVPPDAQPEPCQGTTVDGQPCRVPTRVRVFGTPGHFGCIERAGLVRSVGRSTADEVANILRALRDKVGADLTEDQAVTVLEAWKTALDGLEWRSGWVGDIGTGAYRWLRAKSGADKRGIGGADLDAEPVPADVSLGLVIHLDYCDPGQVPQLGEWLAELDVNGQYLAASSIELGTGAPTIVDRPRSWAGYLKGPGYLVLGKPLKVGPEQLPHTWRAFQGIEAGRSLAMPTVRYLHKRGVALDVARAVIWTDHRRHLDAWYQLFRNGRQKLQDRVDAAAATLGRDMAAEYALQLLKAVTNTMLGGWIRSDKNKGLMRRDWSDHIITEAWHRELIHVERIGEAGALPFGVRRDALWYSVTQAGETPPGAILPTDKRLQLGRLKLVRDRVVPIDQGIIDAHATGSPERVVHAILAARGVTA